MVSIAAPLVGAATAILAFSSSRNALETMKICNAAQEQGACENLPFLSDAEMLSDQDDILEKLKNMKRRDLLNLFLMSEAPENLESIEGEWNGILLNNNIVLTTVTAFITNVLFGKGRTWNGKAFQTKQGINRFNAKRVKDGIEMEHQFDYFIAPSKLDPRNLSLNLQYSPYQSTLSLWKTMRDEVRVLKLPKNTPIDVMIGMGSMSWSGGILNASPFCLWRFK